MAKILKEIQFLTSRPSVNFTSYYPSNGSFGMVKFLKDSFDSISAIYYEAVIAVTYTGVPNSVGVGFTRLYNDTSGGEVSGSEIYGSSASTNYYRLRSGDIKAQLTDGDVLYPQIKVNNSTYTSVQIRSAKLIIIQDGNIRKTATYWLIGDNDSTASATPTEIARRRRVYHDTDEYDGTISYAYHATMASSVGSSVALTALYDVTNAAIRASGGTVSTSPTVVTGTVTGMVDNAEMTSQIYQSGGGTTYIYNAYLIIIQSGDITKTLNPIQVWQTEFNISGLIAGYTVGEFEEAEFDPNDYYAVDIDSKHEASLKSSVAAKTAYSIIKDDGVQITNSEVSTTSTSYTRLRSSSLTEPSALSDIDFDLKGTGGFPVMQAYTCNNRMIIFMTNLIKGPRVNINDSWKTVKAMKINIGDVWKTVSGSFINIGDSWKTIID